MSLRCAPLVARAALAAVACLLALAACGGSAPTTDPTAAARLEPLVLDLPQPVYPAGPPGASGPMAAAVAARSTVLPQQAMAAYLSAHGFRAGYSRVWSYQGAYLTAIVLGFGTPPAATGLVDEATRYLAGSLGTYQSALPGVPGGRLYGLSGLNAKGSGALFCAGAWFAVGPNTYTVTLCSPTRPVGVQEVQPFALDQYTQVSPAPAASATPTTPTTAPSTAATP